jgi:hypothetical protein
LGIVLFAGFFGVLFCFAGLWGLFCVAGLWGLFCVAGVRVCFVFWALIMVFGCYGVWALWRYGSSKGLGESTCIYYDCILNENIKTHVDVEQW